MSVDPARRKKVLRRLTYGLYVVTTTVDGGFTGATVSWLSQCSFEPPLVLLALQREGLLRRGIGETGRAVVHVPSTEDREIVRAFFRPPEPGAKPPKGGTKDAGPSISVPMTFEMVEKIDTYERPCYYLDDLYNMWTPLSFGMKGSAVAPL